MSDMEVDDTECVDCHETYLLDDGCEPTDPPLCHECEKKRLQKTVTDLHAQIAKEREEFIQKLIELTGEVLLEDVAYLAGPIEERESVRIRHNLVEENNTLGLYVHRLESGMCRNGTEGCKIRGEHDCDNITSPRPT